MKLKSLVSGVLVLLSFSAFSFAEDLNETILAKETGVWKTFVGAHPNVDTFAQMVTPDYLCVSPTGKLMTKAENIDELNHLTFSSFKILDPQVRKISKDSALIVARVRYTGAAGTHDISGETLTSTVWVKRSGRWLCQSHSETFAK